MWYHSSASSLYAFSISWEIKIKLHAWLLWAYFLMDNSPTYLCDKSVIFSEKGIQSVYEEISFILKVTCAFTHWLGNYMKLYLCMHMEHLGLVKKKTNRKERKKRLQKLYKDNEINRCIDNKYIAPRPCYSYNFLQGMKLIG